MENKDIASAKRTIDKEVEALRMMEGELDDTLSKALDVMQDGGKIRCLLNAETIRNPCTNERKELAAQLEKLNAKLRAGWER